MLNTLSIIGDVANEYINIRPVKATAAHYSTKHVMRSKIIFQPNRIIDFILVFFFFVKQK